MPLTFSDTEIISAASSQLPTSHSDPPPAYEVTPSLDVIFDIIDKTLNSDVGKSMLDAEIEKLGDSAASVEACFRNVVRGFEKTMEVSMTDLQKAEMQKFQQTWDGHYKTYVKILWKSRRVAGHARVVATDFAGDFLCVIKDEKYSVAEKKKEIANYRKELERDTQNSQELSQSILDLQLGVVKFQEDLRQCAANTNKLRNDVEKLIKEIQKVGVKLTELTKVTLLSTVTTLGLGTAAAGTLAVGAICPSLWERAVKTCKNEKWLNKFNNWRAVSRDLDKKKQIIADLQGSLEGLEKIPAILATFDSDIDFVQQKLGIFAQVWTFVHADLNEIEKRLERAAQIEIQDYFAKKIKAVSTVYMTLAHALFLYETNVQIKELHNRA